jgi:hypothetical protein
LAYPLSAAVSCARRAATLPANVFVAADGNDSNPGTQAKPLASIQATQLRVRKLIQADLKSNITVL